MESGWLVNSILSKSEDSAASRPNRSYQISPIAPPSWRALFQGRKSKMPQGLGRADARACSIVTEYPHVHMSLRRAASKFLKSPTPVAKPVVHRRECEWAEETVSAVSAADRLVTRSDRPLL